MPDSPPAAGQAESKSQAEAQQLLRLVTATEAELRRLPPAAVEAAQNLASQRNGRLRAHGRPRALLDEDNVHDTGAAQTELPSHETASLRARAAQQQHADPDIRNPLQFVLTAEAGLQQSQSCAESWPEADSPEANPAADGASAKPQQATFSPPSTRTVTATAAQRGWHRAAGFQTAQAAQTPWLEAEASRPTDRAPVFLTTAAQESSMRAAAGQETSAGSPRGVESEASWESSQWSDSASETSSSAWSELYAEEPAGLMHTAFTSTTRPLAVVASRSQRQEGEGDSGLGVHSDSAGQMTRSIAAASLPLTSASLLQMRHPDDSLPGKGSWQWASPCSLRVEAVSEQGLSSDDDDAHSSRLLPPGLLAAQMPAVAASTLPLTSTLSMPGMPAYMVVTEMAPSAGPTKDGNPLAASIQPAADPTRLPVRPLPRSGVSSQASAASPPCHSNAGACCECSATLNPMRVFRRME